MRLYFVFLIVWVICVSAAMACVHARVSDPCANTYDPWECREGIR